MITDVDAMAAAVAGQTGARVETVRNALAVMSPEDRQATLRAMGLSFTPNGRKRGRPQHPALIQLRGLFPQMSERTIARYSRAVRLVAASGVSEDTMRNLVEAYTRKSGSFNVSGFEQHAEFLVWAASEGAEL